MLRTPYGIESRGPKALKEYFKDLADDGYIFVFQDIRGRYKSEGQFVMSRPPRDPKDAKAIDEGTDTYDTIDWLLKNVPNNNGRVGMLGISYPGWLTVMALLDPHPALKAASPQASPADMFLGDDFHHNGAFRLSYGFEYVAMMETDKGNASFKFDRYDTFEWYLKLGALSNVNAKYFKGKMPTWNDFVAHPNYDDFWKKQALGAVPEAGHRADAERRRLVRPGRLLRPAQDLRAAREARQERSELPRRRPVEPRRLAAGPGDKLGKIAFDSDTGKYFRAKVQAPFFARHLKDKGDEAAGGPDVPDRQQPVGHARPLAAEDGRRRASSTSIRNGKLAFEPPAETKPAFDEYVSDPAKPVPYRPRPVTPTYPGPEWQVWMVEDQRFTQHRPDVLTYETEPLTEDVTVAGSLTANLFARHERHRLRLDRAADRRLSGEGGEGPEHGRLSAAHQRRTGAGPLPQELREARAGRAGRGERVHDRPALEPPLLPQGAQDHGAGAEHLVPADRPQPAEVRAEHLRGQGRRLSTGPPAGVSLAEIPFGDQHAGHGEVTVVQRGPRLPAGRVPQATTLAYTPTWPL